MPTPSVSFEFFPPRSDAARDRMDRGVDALAPLGPAWMSVTYGAGGSTRDGTADAARRIRARTGARVMAHLTLGGQSRDEVLEAAEALRAAGVRDLLCLRGDPAEEGAAFAPHPDGFRDVPEMMAALPGFTLRVACYPEAHPDARSPDACLDWLRRKVDAGATEAIGQFFFDPATFLRFRDRAAAAGIGGVIVPGLLPVRDWPKAQRFAASCGAAIPPDLAEAFDRAHRHGRADDFALATTCEMADALVREGVGRLHFYTLNRAEPVRAVCRALGVGRSLAAVA
ncbi:methylenetetrahydrofolate reductase [Jannaschia sp. Os4]|uniref:methylenetetrahydrofolate reductase n=1 Tax=Jannaschia sp. Os4 TaxID=2807617 RepID=UPI0019398E96|nr:methylenetetrahydrofolate reductase [Jannaschia sp. Os4]MBM2577733.1 methylenetetrahydrofolate reductase [Jannaschia sp. Os4]